MRVLSKALFFNKKLINKFNLINKMSLFNEVDAAINAQSTDPAINPNASTFFDKIVSKEIPAQVI